MARTAFICDMGDSEESVRSLQLKQRGCSYTLLQVLVGVLAVLVLAMTGGIMWMKMSQNCPERYCTERKCTESYWMPRFTRINNYIDIDFTLPTRGEYEIRGYISINSTDSVCRNTFKLQTLAEDTIAHQDSDTEVIETVTLEKRSKLRIKPNCPFDVAESNLIVYQKTCS